MTFFAPGIVCGRSTSLQFETAHLSSTSRAEFNSKRRLPDVTSIPVVLCPSERRGRRRSHRLPRFDLMFMQANRTEQKQYLAAVGFEPTPPERLVPKTSALDRSATLPRAVIRLSPTVVTGREQHFGDKRERNFSPIT